MSQTEHPMRKAPGYFGAAPGIGNNPLLGPCACSDCGQPLYWARKTTRFMAKITWRLAWRNADGSLHDCSGRPNPRRVASNRRKADAYRRLVTDRSAHPMKRFG